MKRSLLLIMYLLLITAVFAGCSSGEETEKGDGAAQTSGEAGETDDMETASEETNETPVEFPNDEVTLKIGVFWGDGGFEDMHKKPIEEQFPNITVEFLQFNKESAVARAELPDIVLLPSPGDMQSQLASVGVEFDMMPMFKKYDIDLSGIEKNILDDIKRYSPDGELYGLPYGRQAFATTYNKEIFDNFGIDYPTDNMTWEEMIDLAKNLTRNEGGIQYKGIYPGPGYYVLATQLPLKDGEDPEKPTINNVNAEPFKYFLKLLQSIAELPFNYPDSADEREKYESGADAFLKDKTLAMLPDGDYPFKAAAENYEQGNGFDFDITTYPQMSINPGYTPQSFGLMYSILGTTKHPDEAFQVVQWLSMGSYQDELVKDGTVTHMIDVKYKDMYAENKPELREKNYEALFLLKPAPARQGKLVYNLPNNGDTSVVIPGANKAVRLDKDINTILLEMQEAAENNVAEQKARLAENE